MPLSTLSTLTLANFLFKESGDGEDFIDFAKEYGEALQEIRKTYLCNYNFIQGIDIVNIH